MCFSQFSCEPLTLPNHLCYPPPFTCLSNYSHGQLLFFLFFSMLASFFSVLIFIVCFPLSFASLFFLLTSLHSSALHYTPRNCLRGPVLRSSAVKVSSMNLTVKDLYRLYKQSRKDKTTKKKRCCCIFMQQISLTGRRQL